MDVNIILRIEMSLVNLKITFVKKQKQTRERPTQGRSWGAFIYNRNDDGFSVSDSLCTAAPSPQKKIG